MKWQMKKEQYEMNGDTKHKVIDNKMIINIQILSPESINKKDQIINLIHDIR